jgi:hypothetical protein
MNFNKLRLDLANIEFGKIRKDFLLIMIIFIYVFYAKNFFGPLKTNNFKIKNKKAINNIYKYMIKMNDQDKDTKNNTIHRWNENIDDYIQLNINDINAEILNNIGNDFEYIPEMTELYWSTKSNNNSDKQYVSTHMDGPFYYCNLYRALVTINGNKNIHTVFTNESIDTNLKKYDVSLFDYNKTPHYIYINDEKKDNSQRIILKLHYTKSNHCKNVHCKFGRKTRELFERNKKDLFLEGYFARKGLHYYTYRNYFLFMVFILFIYNCCYKDSYSIYVLYLFVLIEVFLILYTLHFNFVDHEKCPVN